MIVVVSHGLWLQPPVALLLACAVLGLGQQKPGPLLCMISHILNVDRKVYVADAVVSCGHQPATHFITATVISPSRRAHPHVGGVEAPGSKNKLVMLSSNYLCL